MKAKQQIKAEHICSECTEAFKTAGSLYTHLRGHGYSIEAAYAHYLIAMAIEAMAARQ